MKCTKGGTMSYDLVTFGKGNAPNLKDHLYYTEYLSSVRDFASWAARPKWTRWRISTPAGAVHPNRPPMAGLP